MNPDFYQPEGGELCGVISVRDGGGNHVMCDAITGKRLSDEQLELRKNSQEYNYFESGVAIGYAQRCDINSYGDVYGKNSWKTL